MTRTHGIRAMPSRAASNHAWEAPAPRREVAYRCDRGHDFTVTYAMAAVPPDTARCRCGGTSRGAEPAEPGGPVTEHARNMTQLRQRRTGADLDLLLAERLAELAVIREAAP